MSKAFDWLGDTRPFTAADDVLPAHFVLEQVDDEKFELRQTFFYHPGDGPPIEVSETTLPDTDFASIPFYLVVRQPSRPSHPCRPAPRHVDHARDDAARAGRGRPHAA